MSRAAAGAFVLGALALAGCGSGSGTVSIPYVPPARQFELAGFQPTAPVDPGRPVTVSFTVKLPSGRPLTSYRTGGGPHTGVHLIIVRDDLGYIVHEHPPVGPDGLLRQTVTLPAPGPYHVLVDIYPNPGPGISTPNFQLTQSIVVRGTYHPIKPPAFSPDVTVDGYRFAMQGHPDIHAVQAQFLHVDVTDPQGRPVHFVPWFGALAHAIFFHEGSLDYFHTHVCAPGAVNCGSLPGVRASAVTGRATAPGKLTVGVLLAVPGTWRLFIQMQAGGRVITAPYTLNVS